MTQTSQSDVVADAQKALRGEQYLLVTTFRRAGSPVSTPVWFALDGERVVIYTGSATGKVKRLKRNPKVVIAPCNFKGRPHGQSWKAEATLLPPEDGPRVMALIDAKYRLWRILLRLYNSAMLRVRRKSPAPTTYIAIAITGKTDGDGLASGDGWQNIAGAAAANLSGKAASGKT